MAGISGFFSFLIRQMTCFFVRLAESVISKPLSGHVMHAGSLDPFRIASLVSFTLVT